MASDLEEEIERVRGLRLVQTSGALHWVTTEQMTRVTVRVGEDSNGRVVHTRGALLGATKRVMRDLIPIVNMAEAVATAND